MQTKLISQIKLLENNINCMKIFLIIYCKNIQEMKKKYRKLSTVRVNQESARKRQSNLTSFNALIERCTLKDVPVTSSNSNVT